MEEAAIDALASRHGAAVEKQLRPIGIGVFDCVVVEILVDAIAARIRKYPIECKGSWFFYRAYYDEVGMSRARPEAWDEYKTTLEKVLIDHQHEEGWWQTPPSDNEGRFGRVYITSMAVLALAVEHHALPVYQR